MAIKYLDDSGLTRYDSKIKNVIATKQDALVSGTNIKTINNTSILGSGNISISSGTPTDVQINGTTITSNNVADIQTNGTYDSSSNKIATMSDFANYYTKNDVDNKFSNLEAYTQLFSGGGSGATLNVGDITQYKYLVLHVKVKDYWWYEGVITVDNIKNDINNSSSAEKCWIVPGVSSNNNYGRAWVVFTSLSTISSIGSNDAVWLKLFGVK